MFWNKKQPTSQQIQIEWHEKPGCFERHLQRRCDNPLFSADRRTISSEELNEARKKDDGNLKEFIKQYTLWLSSANNLKENSSVEDIKHCLQDTQYLEELSSAVGCYLENEISVLEAMEQKLTSFMNAQVPQGAELLEEAHSLSVTQRIPYFAQAGMKDTPILKNEELASLLSEDMETIKIAGFMSRSFSPNYRPNSEDVQKLLDEAVKNGLDSEYAKEVVDAFSNTDKQIDLTPDELNKIESVINIFLQKGFTSNNPKFIVLAGPIASGKTTILREKYSKDYVLIDSGELLDAFNGKDGDDPEKKAGYLMIAGIELVKRSIAQKRNIVIEITADTNDKADKMKQISEKMSLFGYKTEMQYIHCDPEECEKRNLKGRDNVSSYYSTDETLHYFTVAFENM